MCIGWLALKVKQINFRLGRQRPAVLHIKTLIFIQRPATGYEKGALGYSGNYWVYNNCTKRRCTTNKERLGLLFWVWIKENFKWLCHHHFQWLSSWWQNYILNHSHDTYYLIICRAQQQLVVANCIGAAVLSASVECMLSGRAAAHTQQTTSRPSHLKVGQRRGGGDGGRGKRSAIVIRPQRMNKWSQLICLAADYDKNGNGNYIHILHENIV